MKIARIVWWLSAFSLLLLYLAIVGSYTGLHLFFSIPLSASSVACWIMAAIAGMVLLMGVMARPRRWRKPLSILSGIVFLAMLAFFVWFLRDEPSLADDYTESKLLHASNGSYAHLLRFQSSERSAALQDGLKRLQKIDDPLQQDALLDELWQTAAEYREAIAALDSFDVINDLPEGQSIDGETPFLNFGVLRDVTDLYRHFLLRAVRHGRSAQAAEEVLRLHRVMRRSMTDSTILIHKAMFIALTGKTLQMALSAANDHLCDPAAVRAFSDHLTPLARSEYSLARVIQGEYLFAKNSMDQYVRPETFLDSVSRDGAAEEERNLFRTAASLVTYHLAYKPQTSRRQIREMFDLWVACDRRSPPDYTALSAYREKYANTPQLRNMAGWILNAVAAPSFENFSERATTLKIQSDLLSLALHRRQGRVLELSDFFIPGPCRLRDEGYRLCHPGPDGVFDTEDDIVLESTAPAVKG